MQALNIVIAGLTVTSSWGNGHATTYRSLIKGLSQRGHRIHFLERDAPWYAENRDQPKIPGATVIIYKDVAELSRYVACVRQADLVIVGSYVPDGIEVGWWFLDQAKGPIAFYDIDTPVTVASLEEDNAAYINKDLIQRYDAYLSFTSGPTLRLLEKEYGAKMARELYCSVDSDIYLPTGSEHQWDLGYLGTYSDDRQPVLDELLLKPARQWSDGKSAVAGPQYPEDVAWPENVDRTVHLSPGDHAAFYGAQRYTLNVTRAAMRKAGYSPSVRLFEAGACGTAIISDYWEGLPDVFRPGREILISNSAEDSLRILHDLPESQRTGIAAAARARVLEEHTAGRRAAQLESYLKEMHDNVSSDSSRSYRRSWPAAGGKDEGMVIGPSGPGAGGKASAKAFND